jgi:predicted TIM-barrel fold metal-dependent hydrolase
VYNAKKVINMLIDFHTHCFPDKISQKAMEKLSFASGGLNPYTDGTVSGLRLLMEKSGVDKSVALNIATNAHQQRAVNDFAAYINSDDIIAFGSVYPYSEDALEELERIKELGLKGIKLHPDYQGFNVDDIKLKPLYKKIGELSLITVFHAGNDYGYAPPYGATPEKMERALDWFTSPVVVAHWGGVGCGEGVLKHLAGKNIYFDTSYAYGTQPKFYFEKILEKHGADRLLFGTDTPWHTADMELRLLKSLGIRDTDMEKITHKNAEKLLGI